MNKDRLVPRQERGKQLDLQERKTFSSGAAARAAYETALQRLLHPRQWQRLCGKEFAAFEVIGKDLEQKDQAIEEGDYIRINIPGPGPASGNGYDWVRVSIIKQDTNDDERSAGIKLVPCPNPTKEDTVPAHFFTGESSSTLTLELRDTVITSFYHGRNEVPNNETGKVAGNIRNTLVAAGALAGLSELQWTRLLQALPEI